MKCAALQASSPSASVKKSEFACSGFLERLQPLSDAARCQSAADRVHGWSAAQSARHASSRRWYLLNRTLVEEGALTTAEILALHSPQLEIAQAQMQARQCPERPQSLCFPQQLRSFAELARNSSSENARYCKNGECHQNHKRMPLPGAKKEEADAEKSSR